MIGARGVFALGAAAALASCQTTPPLADFPDLLIMNGTLHDGSGADGRKA